MKKYLLLSMATAVAIAAAAGQETPEISIQHGVSKTQVMKGKSSPALSTKKFGRSVKESRILSPSGKQIRKVANMNGTRKVNPLLKKIRKASSLPEGTVLWESFEGFDPAVPGWLPEGWTVISNGDPTLEAGAQWGVDLGGFGYGVPAAPDGDYFIGIGFSESALEQDEWLILPEVKIEDSYQLKFQLYTTPLFFFETWNEEYDVIDWDNMEWLVDPVVNGDLTVQIKVGDGEWTRIWSMMDQFKNLPLEDLMMYEQFDTYSVPLGDYAGKDVKIAFNYKAVDCNTVYLDCVSIGLPSVDNISYLPPFETLYWGFDNSADWVALNTGIAQYPVYGPLSFMNNWTEPEATYSWRYHDPITNDWATSDDEDVLDVTYYPDYSSEFTCRNNLYYPPELIAEAKGATPGSYTMPVTYMQAGGKPEFMVTLSDGSRGLMDFGLLPFNTQTDGYGITLIDAPSVGDMALPIFGFNRNSNKYWLDYTLNGSEPSECDDVKMVAILNFIYAPTAPMVIDGVHVNAFGNMEDDAELKIEIIACDEDFIPMDEAIASATCKYAQMDKYESSLSYIGLNIPFKFDTPVVLDNRYPAYIVKLSGFNSDKVETFIPVQSIVPNEYLCHGWLEKAIKIDSEVYRTSYSPMANVEGNYGPCMNAFAINLEAYYPWLECPVTETSIYSDGTPTVIDLGSYYDGSELSVSTPTGLQAEASGRYNECVLTLMHDDTEVIVNGDVVITAPGVEKRIKVSESTVGVDTIGSEDGIANVVTVYSVDGKQVSPATAN
ncbi:MAG: choice-of-anchor J domain-containing protein, partial [Muribaculaceae bacterium]|nr:choice-of-anchor J domain-containing protein [Muribaculaceae bacterium]